MRDEPLWWVPFYSKRFVRLVVWITCLSALPYLVPAQESPYIPNVVDFGTFLAVGLSLVVLTIFLFDEIILLLSPFKSEISSFVRDGPIGPAYRTYEAKARKLLRLDRD